MEKLEGLSPISSRFGSGMAGLGPGDEFCAYVDAAVALIDIGPGLPTSSSSPTCDPDLWSHVGGLVEAEMWDKVPPAVVTFVEHWFRQHAGDPPNPKGGRLYGKGLFQELLKPGSALALGSDASETEGWRELGTGIMKAIGNGHRHSITERSDDLARWAWGVIGLGSLLITEMKSTHPAD